MKKLSRYDHTQPGAIDPAQCNGCGVCMLSCPVWHQHRTKALTYCGRNRAAIGGADEDDLAPSAAACILCGSCEPLCPMGIRTQQSTIALRRNLARRGLLPNPRVARDRKKPERAAASRLIIPGASLRDNGRIISAVLRVLGGEAKLHADDGSDLLLSLEAGGEVSDAQIQEYLAPLEGVPELIVADGLMFNLLYSALPSPKSMLPLGPALLRDPNVRAGIKSTDFYMIETRAYNAHRHAFVELYSRLRRETGCTTNLDLQRVATPTGASCMQHREGLKTIISIEEQVKWLLEGRRPARIVVEHPDDLEAFSRYTKLPVVHLAEVAKP